MPGRVRLFCLPYAGASAAVFAQWRRGLPDAVDVRPVELPGRGSRIGEAPCTDPRALTRRLADEVAGSVTGSYALFGHSLGALLAFELAHELRDRGIAAPRALFASGCAGPAVCDGAYFRRPRSDADLRDALSAHGATPPEALADPALMALVLPVLRADFRLRGAYTYAARPALDCPIQALGGTRDDVARADLEAWGRETRGPFDLALFEGDHFFIHARRGPVLDLVGRRIGARAEAAA